MTIHDKLFCPACGEHIIITVKFEGYRGVPTLDNLECTCRDFTACEARIPVEMEKALDRMAESVVQELQWEPPDVDWRDVAGDWTFHEWR